MTAGDLLSEPRLQRPAILGRLRDSAVVWSWAFNGLRLAAGLILLPLVLNKFSKPDVGMYYVLLNLAGLVVLVDFGFGPTLGRFISYAMGGAEEIQAQGIARPGTSTCPNYRLLWELLFTTRTLYRYLTLLLFVVLGLWGTYCVELKISETSSVLLTRAAWAATLLTACFDIYATWWIIYLRSMNQVRVAAQIGLLGIGARLVIAAALLLAGGGLLSLPIASFFGSLIQRGLARYRCLKLLPEELEPERVDLKRTFSIIWPNTWRLGMQFFSNYLVLNVNMALCLHVLGLPAYGQYGLSVQLLGILSGVASVWTLVKWPLIGQLYAQHNPHGIQKVIWPRLWLQNATFIIGCAAVLLAGPFLLEHFGGGKQALPRVWFGLMMLNGLLEMQFIIWGTLLFTENNMIYIWPTVATNVLSVVLSSTFILFTSLGFGALVLGPLISGVLFNYWFWPLYSARRLGTRLFAFLFARPAKNQSEAPELPQIKAGT